MSDTLFGRPMIARDFGNVVPPGDIIAGPSPFDALRLCTHEGCEAPRHYENCPRCFGFGFTTDGTIRSAGEAMDAPDADGIPCPHCHSTAKGAPHV